MALFHFHVGQIKRSSGQSAIACAAYRAGEKLHSEYYGDDSDYTHKGGVVCSEILLPTHAPPEYADRETLWNAVEKAEKHPKAQLAYSFDIALQNEFSMAENIELARQFLLENFVSRGMIVDFAIHQPDKGDGIPNPHFHVMCPIRPLNEDGTWGAKQHREYILDENGERIQDANGDYVFNAVQTTDWGSPETLEHWRQAWADLCNAKFSERELNCRIDHRSYERQGIDQLPTIHEGPAVQQMEAKGIRTDKGDLNRWIKATNNAIRNAKKLISALMDWITEAKEKLSQPQQPSLAQLLGDFYTMRSKGAYSQRAKTNNLKAYSEEYNFLQARGITDLDHLHAYVSDLSGKVHATNSALRQKSDRMRELKKLLRLAEDYRCLKPVIDAIPPKGGFGKKREKYMAENKSEIDQFYAVKRKLDSLDIPGKKLTVKEWNAELDALNREYTMENESLKPIYADLKKLRDIQYKLDTFLHDQPKERTQEQNLNR